MVLSVIVKYKVVVQSLLWFSPVLSTGKFKEVPRSMVIKCEILFLSKTITSFLLFLLANDPDV